MLGFDKGFSFSERAEHTDQADWPWDACIAQLLSFLDCRYLVAINASVCNISQNLAATLATHSLTEMISAPWFFRNRAMGTAPCPCALDLSTTDSMIDVE